jgi:hypothetical protein
MAIILIHVGKNLVEDMLLDGDLESILLLRIIFLKLGLPTPRLTLYTLKMVDHTLPKPIRLIWDFKIHIHGIPYVVTFTVMHNNILDSSYSMLFGHP